jgi:Ca2+-binding EF-hand superfamily protein
MFKFKSVVFIIVIFAICSVLSKHLNTNYKLKSKNQIKKINFLKKSTFKSFTKQENSNESTELTSEGINHDSTAFNNILNYFDLLTKASEEPNALDNEYNVFNWFVRNEYNETDTDHDGVVSYDEYKARLLNSTYELGLPEDTLSDEVLEYIFKEFNTNNDRELDYNEFANLVKASVQFINFTLNFLKGSPYEKLINMSDSLNRIYEKLYFSQDQGELNYYNNALELKYGKDLRVITPQDARLYLESFVLASEPDYELRKSVLSEVEELESTNTESLSSEEFNQIVRNALYNVAKSLEEDIKVLTETAQKYLEDLQIHNTESPLFLKFKKNKKIRNKKNLKSVKVKKTYTNNEKRLRFW